MQIYGLIKKKRDGYSLNTKDIKYFIKKYTENKIPDYQASALAMAIFFQGMNHDEILALTYSMLHSGKILNFSHLNRCVIDKHSTGGVGDKTSIALVPAVASYGIGVPMMSGGSLGHTGGTLDKLSSIPNLNTNISINNIYKLIKQHSCCFISSTQEITPADKKFYALRGVTGTVECFSLIMSSIMSKKLSEGINGLVLDVKYGSGAFIENYKDAKKFALSIVKMNHIIGKKIIVRLSDMSQPLGNMIGNALEIEESIDILHGNGPNDLKKHICELGGEMLFLGNIVQSLCEGKALIKKSLLNGNALEKFAEIISAQNGNYKVIFNKKLLPQANKKIQYLSTQSGYLIGINTKQIGIVVLLLGGGRQKLNDRIDPRVGLKMHVKIGDKIIRKQILCTIFLGDKNADEALCLLKKSFYFSKESVSAPNLFGMRIVA